MSYIVLVFPLDQADQAVMSTNTCVGKAASYYQYLRVVFFFFIFVLVIDEVERARKYKNVLLKKKSARFQIFLECGIRRQLYQPQRCHGCQLEKLSQSVTLAVSQLIERSSPLIRQLCFSFNTYHAIFRPTQDLDNVFVTRRHIHILVIDDSLGSFYKLN